VTEVVEVVGRDLGVVWTMLIPQYFFFTGVSAAAFLVSSLTYGFGDRRFERVAGLSLIVALTVLLVAPLNLIADLEQPARFYSLLFRVNGTSPMSWGVFLLSAYPLLIAVEMAFAFRAGHARRAQDSTGWRYRWWRTLAFGDASVTEATQQRDHRMSRALALLGIPMALAVHGYTGYIVGVVAARPLWHTPLMPVIFLVSAMVSGIGLLVLLSWMLVRGREGSPDRAVLERLGVLLGWAIVGDLLLRGLWYSIGFAYSGEAGQRVGAHLFGAHWVETVVIELGLALVLPAIVVLTPALRRRLPLLLSASVLTVVGVWFFRWATVIGGQEIPRLGPAAPRYLIDFWDRGVAAVAANWALWIFLMIVLTWILPWRAAADPEPPPAGPEDEPALAAAANRGER
jgi:tetrathionate reductase subunit C